jgi:hypothetical protein
MNEKLAKLPTHVLKPLVEGLKDSLLLSTAILGSVATVISSFSSHRGSDDKGAAPRSQETHPNHC